jgi:hypothetical protein
MVLVRDVVLVRAVVGEQIARPFGSNRLIGYE